MNLTRATKLAERIKGELQEWCDLIEIAGSVRRQRPECNDVDLVILPKAGAMHAIRERCLRNGTVVLDGAQNFIVKLNGWGSEPDGFQVDLFIARQPMSGLFESTPTNFGSLLLCRTGSKEHNIFMIDQAKRCGCRWNPYEGVYSGGRWEHVGEKSEYIGGKLTASETEGSIFKALGMEFVAPDRREK